MRRCLVRTMYLSASEVAVSTMGRYNKGSTFTFYTVSRVLLTSVMTLPLHSQQGSSDKCNVEYPCTARSDLSSWTLIVFTFTFYI